MKNIILVLLLTSFSFSQLIQPRTVTTFECAFSPKMGSQQLVAKAIDESKKSIYIAAYSFTSDTILKALLRAKNRNVKIQVVCDSSNAKDSHAISKDLIDSGVSVIYNGKYKILHHKFMIIDSSTLQLGSFNYSQAAYTSNAENVLVIRKAPLDLIYQYYKQWLRMATEQKK